MLTKTEFFALLNDENNKIGVTAHITAREERNGMQALIIEQKDAPNAWLSNHKAATTTNAAFKKYNAWLNEWFTAQAEEAQARIDVLDIEAAHAEALAFNAEVDEVAASEQFDDWADKHDSRKTESQMIDGDHDEALVMNAAYDVAIKVVADNLSLPVWEGCTETVKREVIKVHHEEARIMNRLIGNADLIPSCRHLPQEIKVYLWGVNSRLYPSVIEWDYNQSWDYAIAENTARRNLKH